LEQIALLKIRKKHSAEKVEDHSLEAASSIDFISFAFSPTNLCQFVLWYGKAKDDKEPERRKLKMVDQNRLELFFSDFEIRGHWRQRVAADEWSY